MVIKQGEIWWAELPEPAGSGPGYRRPLVIMQSNAFNNSNISTVIAAVVTSNLNLAEAPGNLFLATQKSKLPRKSVINVSQLITVDKDFLTERVAQLPVSIMDKLDDGMRLVLKL